MELTQEKKDNLQFSLDSKMLKLAQKCIQLSDELKKTLNYFQRILNQLLKTF